MTGVLTAWLVEVCIITYRDTQKGKNQGTAQLSLPMPSVYASTFLIFGVLGLLPARAMTVANLAAWGLVVATFLNLWAPLTGGQTHASVAQSGTKNAAGNPAA
jgi:hypothetical protein